MINKIPDISVVVCAFNHAKWLERCIRSLNHQDFIQQEMYEIIIVDDGSTDSTKEVLKNLENVNNIKIHTNETNIGLPQSLNTAIRGALGRYIVRVDSDDYVSRSFLHLMKLFLDMNRQHQAVATDYIVVDQFENIIKRENCFDNEIACGIMFRKECLFEIGLYDESFLMREGHDLRSRFEDLFSVARLEYPLYKYRQHSNNRTKDKEEVGKYDRKLGSIKKIKKQFDKSIFDCIDESREFVKKKYNLVIGNNIDLICEKLYKANSPGAYIECGVYKGNTFFAVAEFIKRKNLGIKAYGFDTFGGFPVAFGRKDHPEYFSELFGSGIIDKDHYDKASARTNNFTNIDHLQKEYFELDFDKVNSITKDYSFSTMIDGVFSETLQEFNEDISVLFIDCDLYESYFDCFLLFDRVLPGGAIIFDEYYSLKYPGAVTAVREFFNDKDGWLEEYYTNDGFKRVCFVKGENNGRTPKFQEK